MEHLRFATGILSRLGEELNPNPDQGILELVRNSYDADALTCKIELLKTEQTSGTIRISDDGIGMDRDGLINGWLVLGKSVKNVEHFTDRGRRVVGNKGLGRLAALRLGHVATVYTFPQKQSDEFSLRIDWAAFDSADVVEQVPLTIERKPKSAAQKHGTVITIDKLRSVLSRAEVRRLARSLVLLADPFGDTQEFKPT